jgi:polysaccharide chain length determinant protein (PEP-CTERM system associated)
MNAAVEQAFEQLRGAWRFRRAAVLVAWGLALAGWLVVLALPDSFGAQARVYVDTSTALRPLLQGITVDDNVEAQLNLVRESLLGRTRLERVARDADLDLKVKTPADRESLLATLRQKISIEAVTPGGNREARRSSDSIYTIAYQNSSRDKALAVVRSLLNALVEETLSGKRSGADTAQKFLRDQIAEYESRLAAAEASLAEFKKRNVGLVPGAQGDYFARLQAEIAATQKARAALDVALRRREELNRQLRGEKSLLPASSMNKGLSPRVAVSVGGPEQSAESVASGSDTASRIATAQARLDDLLLRFTDKHPDVVAARETLTQLKERQAAELEALRRGDPGAIAGSGLAANPVYQTIQLQLNQTDVEIAAIRGDLSEHERAESELRRVVNTAPGVEAEFSRLNRDYDVTKAQYNSLVDRLEKAKLSDDAQQTGVVRFEIIDPPTSPLDPVAPKRPLLMALVLLAALGAGLGVAWLMSQLRPVFNTVQSLADVTGLPVLGGVTVTWIQRLAGEFRRSLLVVAGATAGLVAVFLVALVLHQAGARAVHRLVTLG